MKRILLAMLVLMTVMPLVMAEPLVDPVEYEKDVWQSGNAEFECNEVGACCDFAYKIDEWQCSGMDGTYTHEGNNITISNSNGYTFDWESQYPVCAVIVKGGPGANVYYYYVYEEPIYSDTGLVAPDDKEISHVTFCFNDPGDGDITEIPEFPTVALPIAAILGLAFVFQRRKE